jgi:hypothetical protein
MCNYIPKASVPNIPIAKIIIIKRKSNIPSKILLSIILLMREQYNHYAYHENILELPQLNQTESNLV